jgi:hypothetical protein
MVMTRPDNNAGDSNDPNADPDPSHFEVWYDWIQPYMRTHGLDRCPSYAGLFPVPDGWGVPNRFMHTNYAISGHVVYSDVQGRGGNLMALAVPAETFLVTETPGGVTWFRSYGPGWTCPDILEWNGQMHLVQFIRGGTDDWGDPAITALLNVIAADGHTKAVRMSNLNGGGVFIDQDGRVREPGWGGMYCFPVEDQR